MPAVPAAKSRVPAPHYLPCMRRLRRQRGCLRSSIHNVSPSRNDDGNDDDNVLVAGLLIMLACGDGDGGVSHPFLLSGSDMYVCRLDALDPGRPSEEHMHAVSMDPRLRLVPISAEIDGDDYIAGGKVFLLAPQGLHCFFGSPPFPP